MQFLRSINGGVVVFLLNKSQVKGRISVGMINLPIVHGSLIAMAIIVGCYSAMIGGLLILTHGGF